VGLSIDILPLLGRTCRKARPMDSGMPPESLCLGSSAWHLIAFAAVRIQVDALLPRGIGPGTISLLYLIVIVFVSLRGGLSPQSRSP